MDPFDPRLTSSRLDCSNITNSNTEIDEDDSEVRSGPKVIKLFSCSTQLITNFQLLKNTKIPTNKEVSCFKSLNCCIYHANKC